MSTVRGNAKENVMTLWNQIKNLGRSAKACPKCGGTNARLRKDWPKRKHPFRCRSCNAVFGQLRQVQCPFCGAKDARMRRDWHVRENPVRCRKCMSVWGGASPSIGKSRRANECGECECCEAHDYNKWTVGWGGMATCCGECRCCIKRHG